MSATLARRIYLSSSKILIKRYEPATSRPHDSLVIDLKSSTPEQHRLRDNIFEADNPKKRKLIDGEYKLENDFSGEGNFSDKNDYHDDEDEDEEDNDDDDDDNSVENWNKTYDTSSIQKRPLFRGLPGKRRKEERSRREKWDKRFQEPHRQSIKNNLKLKLLCANQQQNLQSPKKLKSQHDMTVKESIRHAIARRKDLFDALWPDHKSKEEYPMEDNNEGDDDQGSDDDE
ncbi:uncharacterized protein LOC128556696 [Mercenaria mercenaria]|uniref:uncharacterized protein LOC128556696 n=1 Tax=Mercenaria mercenaria TaxID=6596 RepID=UPI00234F361A|nr:uncharacterized protein LOC128556696 [Mercenaria mercenaria]